MLSKPAYSLLNIWGGGVCDLPLKLFENFEKIIFFPHPPFLGVTMNGVYVKKWLLLKK
jgi:hypothetical protein